MCSAQSVSVRVRAAARKNLDIYKLLGTRFTKVACICVGLATSDASKFIEHWEILPAVDSSVEDLEARLSSTTHVSGGFGRQPEKIWTFTNF
jgi:hypothetical protein